MLGKQVGLKRAHAFVHGLYGSNPIYKNDQNLFRMVHFNELTCNIHLILQLFLPDLQIKPFIFSSQTEAKK